MIKKYKNYNIINLIKNRLINYYDLKTWKHFIDNQELGDCQTICNDIIFLMKNEKINLKHHFGIIIIDNNFYDYKYNEYIKELTHHWISLNNEIYEFSKGTLKHYINYNDIYCVKIDDKWRYHQYY
jgi:hypothetical protein